MGQGVGRAGYQAERHTHCDPRGREKERMAWEHGRIRVWAEEQVAPASDPA